MSAHVSRQHIDQLRSIVGETGVLTNDELSALDPGLDTRNLDASVLVRPTTIDMLERVVGYCVQADLPVVAHGGRTGLALGGVTQPGDVIVDLNRLNRIEHIDPIGGTATVEAGVTLYALEQAVNEHGLSVGIDLGARGSATIGGMVSSNAGGIEAFRNGTTRHRVLGIEAILANGQRMTDLKRVTKANEGYSLSQLFVGAEGTLGVISRVSLSLVPIESARRTALVSLDSADAAVRLFRRLHNRRDGRLLSAELMWPEYARAAARHLDCEPVLLFESEPDAFFGLFEVADANDDGQRLIEAVLEDALADGELRNAVVAQNTRERDAMWQIREESFAAEASHSSKIWFDVSVPLSELDTYTNRLRRAITSLDQSLDLFVIAHIGDGNIHTTVASNDAFDEHHETIARLHFESLAVTGGSFSAEHGIGLEKRAALERYASPAKLDAMRAIKAALDPKGLMNPGKILRTG